MAGRIYTIDEIHRMRKAVADMLPIGMMSDDPEVMLVTEARLHTYILSGVEPAELEGAAIIWDPLSDS
jgi:hypothetical protein